VIRFLGGKKAPEKRENDPINIAPVRAIRVINGSFSASPMANCGMRIELRVRWDHAARGTNHLQLGGGGFAAALSGDGGGLGAEHVGE